MRTPTGAGMSDEYFDIDEAKRWTKKRYWPWALAVAYCQDDEHRVDAIRMAVTMLETYPRMSTFDQFTASCAYGLVHQAVNGDVEMSVDTMAALEFRLVNAIEAGEVQTFGKKASHEEHVPISAARWSGAAIVSSRTADLYDYGQRLLSLDPLGCLSNDYAYRYFDIHVLGYDMRAMIHGKLAFLPSEAHGSPRKMDEMISLSVHGVPSRDLSLFEGPDGATVVKFARGITTEEQAQDMVARETAGRLGVHEALLSGEIRGLVQSKANGAFASVDRHYWLRASAADTRTLSDEHWAIPDEYDGQPLLADEGHLGEWTAAADIHLSKFPAPIPRPPSAVDIATNSRPAITSGLPGRPTSKNVIFAMLEKRIETGDFYDDQLAESTALSQLLDELNSRRVAAGNDPYVSLKPKSIRPLIRDRLKIASAERGAKNGA